MILCFRIVLADPFHGRGHFDPLDYYHGSVVSLPRDVIGSILSLEIRESLARAKHMLLCAEDAV